LKVKSSLIIACFSVVIVGLLLVGGSYNPFETISNNDLSYTLVSNVVLPTETIVIPEKKISNPVTVTANTIESFTKPITITTNSIKPLSQKAFAIGSDQNDVMVEQWVSPSHTGPGDQANIVGIAEDPGNSGVIWVTEGSVDKITRVNSINNEITQWPIPPLTVGGFFPFHIVVDNDNGDAWFASLNKGKIGRINPITNQYTEYTVAPAGNNLFEITSDFGFNGQEIWFAEFEEQKVGRLVPSTNALTEWSSPTSHRPSGIAFDENNGNVWFTQGKSTGPGSSSIARLNPTTNEIITWIIPTSNAGPEGITIDKFNEIIFFAEQDSGKIARLVPATNVITEWTIPGTFTGFPEAVAIDPQGTVYFNTQNTGNIGRLVPSTNVFTLWTPPTAGSVSPRDVIVDGNDNVWFTQSSDDIIGRLSEIPVVPMG